ncbi:MAG: glycoside hydrolase family 88 protein [Myxococcota bacterium]|nr:glycoside hydrolase family 88 protein [Myxococcota bacterium]
MYKNLWALGFSCLLTLPFSARALEIISPTDDGVVIGDTARFIILCDGSPRISAIIEGNSHPVLWTKESFGGRWVGDVFLPSKGDHTVLLEGQCGNTQVSAEVHFDNSIESSIEIADLVISRFFSKNKPDSLDWNWGPAIFLYPLLKIAPKSVHAAQYISYVIKYHQHHLSKGLPKIQWADACPSALSAFDLAIAHHDGFAWSSVEKVISWIKTAKRNKVGSIDHLGYNNIKSFWFPSSIWVDSLMMWDVLAVKYALYAKDENLLRFGVDQPFVFADNLRNPQTGLFFHAWNLDKDLPYPENNAHWLRGNGWALVSMAEILLLIGEEHERYQELSNLFVDLAEAIFPYRQPSGYWDTVVDDPGYAYEESSGSALVATGYAIGARLGLLPPEYRQLARDTFQAITARMKRRSPGFTMEEISMGTNPESKLGYKLIPKDRNISYGVGAFLLLANELSEDSFDSIESIKRFQLHSIPFQKYVALPESSCCSDK